MTIYEENVGVFTSLAPWTNRLHFNLAVLVMEKNEEEPQLSLWRKISKDRIRIFRTTNLYLSYFSLGLCMSIPGPTLPDLQSNVNATTAQMGYVLAAKLVGYCAGSLVGGFIFSRFHRLFLFTLCLLIMSLSFFAIPWAKDFALLILFMIINGLVSGAIDTGANVLCLDLWSSNPAPFFQALHFHYGLGTVVGPLIAEPFLSPEDEFVAVNSTGMATTQMPSPKDPGNLVATYSIAAALVLAVCISNLASFIIDRTEVKSNCEKERVYNQASGTLWPKFLIGFGLVFVAAYVSLENTYGQFLTTFVTRSELKMTKSKGSFMTSTFWGTYCFVRGLSIYGATKVKPAYMLLLNISVLTTGSIVLVIFGEKYPWVMWMGSAILGLGCASCFPSCLAFLESYMGITNFVAGLFVVSGSGASFLMALLVAYFMDDHSEVFLYTICSGSVICLFAFASQLKVVHHFKRNFKEASSSTQNLEKSVN